jgi:hypothetical protein
VTNERQTYQANIIVPIPREQLVDVLTEAQGACAYWAADISLDGESLIVDEIVTEGEPETKRHTVPMFSLAAAVEGLASGKLPVRADIARYIREALLDPESELGELDWDAADVIVQYAVFGELVYG